METTRQNKIARLIQKELSEIFMLQTKAMKGVLVSVSACRISPDLSVCRVYLSVFPSERSEEIVKNINANMKSDRKSVGYPCPLSVAYYSGTEILCRRFFGLY